LKKHTDLHPASQHSTAYQTHCLDSEGLAVGPSGHHKVVSPPWNTCPLPRVPTPDKQGPLRPAGHSIVPIADPTVGSPRSRTELFQRTPPSRVPGPKVNGNTQLLFHSRPTGGLEGGLRHGAGAGLDRGPAEGDRPAAPALRGRGRREAATGPRSRQRCHARDEALHAPSVTGPRGGRLWPSTATGAPGAFLVRVTPRQGNAPGRRANRRLRSHLDGV
jgi:hypothetical protein